MSETKCEFVADVKTVERFPLYLGGCPYLINDPGKGHQVKGELYAMTANVHAALDRLDRLEGHPRLYRRELVEVCDAANNTVTAWTYFYVYREVGDRQDMVEEYITYGEKSRRRIFHELRRVS